MPKVDQILLFVADPHKSAKFYQELGFEVVTESDESAIVRMGGFRVYCQNKANAQFPAEAGLEPKGAGVYIYLRTDNVDETYRLMVAQELKPSSEPRDWPWGNREFVIRDPDRYKLVFYQSLK